MEHRCGTRYRVDIAVYVRPRNSAISAQGRLSEISASGGFVRTVHPAFPLSYIAIQLLSDGWPPHEVLLLEGQVVRRTHDGLCIEWSEYAPELVRLLVEEPAVAAALDLQGRPHRDPRLKWEA